MAEPPSRKTPYEPIMLRYEEDDPEPSPQPAKKRKEKIGKDEIVLSAFKKHVERSLEIWVTHGMIGVSRKIEYLSAIPAKDESSALSNNEAEEWCANTYKNVVQKLNSLSQNHFAVECPNRISTPVFSEKVLELFKKYADYIATNLQKCAEASRKNQRLCLVPDCAPFFPIQPADVNERLFLTQGCGLNVKFQAVYDFCKQHSTLLRETKISDGIECVIHHLWNQENRLLFSLSIGCEVLDLGKKISSLLQKGDFFYGKRKKEFSDRIVHFDKEVRVACCRVSQMDINTDCFIIDKTIKDHQFPICTGPSLPPYPDLCVATAWKIREWMHQYHTLQLMHTIPEFSTLMQKVRLWAEGRLNGDLLKSELEACDEISKAMLSSWKVSSNV